MWSSRTPQRVLQQTPRTEFRAPEHLEELSSSLQGPSFELPNTSRSSQAVSQDRIPSSRTSRGAVKQPPRNEFRAPKQASQEDSKQSKGKQASKQPCKQASNQTSKRANEQTSKRANEQASTRPNEQTSKQASKRSAGCPEGLAIRILNLMVSTFCTYFTAVSRPVCKPVPTSLRTDRSAAVCDTFHMSSS